MHITLSPVRMDETLMAEVAGDVLILNGEALDFTPLPDGTLLPREAVDSPWITGDVWREAGELHVTLILPHGGNPPPETLFPAPLIVGDGPVALPLHTALPAKEPADAED